MHMNWDSRPNAAWKWIVGGISLALVGAVVFAFIVSFEIPVPGRSGGFLFLTPLGVGIMVYGFVLLWRERSKGKNT
jgi:hypothetical protein